MVLILDEKTALAIEEAIKVLESGGVVIYPTDTLYGIGCDGTSAKAVTKVHSIKKSDLKKPLSVIMADPEMIMRYCEVDEGQKEEMKRKLPGPYTFILKSKEKIAAAGDSSKLGVRMPDNEFCLFLCKKFGKPIVSTSANLTGQKAPVSLDEVDKKVLEAVDLAIDGGKTRHKRPSEIIDLVEGKKVR
jgi:L-threonylcarbamoyladenylate synthase